MSGIGDHRIFCVDGSADYLLRQHMLNVFTVQVIGWVLSPQGWILSKAAQEYPQVLAAMLHTARFELGVSRCFGARVGRGSHTLAGFYGAERVMLVWWPADAPRLFSTLEHDATITLDLRHFFFQ